LRYAFRLGKIAPDYNDPKKPMSLEYELQKFPREIKLKDGSSSRLRPLRKDDEKAFHEFFLAVPEPERMFIKHRVIDPAIIRDWCQHIDLGRNLPLLAQMDGKIVGDATLHQQLGGWKRHIGRVSVLVLPKYRGRGLARALVSEIVIWAWSGSKPNSSASRRRLLKCSHCSALATSCDWRTT
jgi:GNAT superfamily N-acetyltransferase